MTKKLKRIDRDKVCGLILEAMADLSELAEAMDFKAWLDNGCETAVPLEEKADGTG